jgi:Zn-dependent protease
MVILILALNLVILIFSVMLHEIAHGFVAFLTGDNTARKAGRLTMNPAKHIDLMGSIVLPALLIISRSPVLFGWAKPIPINPNHMRHPKWDIVWVSLAGPLMNAVLVVSAIFCLHGLVSVIGSGQYHTFMTQSMMVRANLIMTSESGAVLLLIEAMIQMIVINSILTLFNLIPIPPLDGSRIFIPLLPKSWEPAYQTFEKYGIILVVALLYFNVFDNWFREWMVYIMNLIWMV